MQSTNIAENKKQQQLNCNTSNIKIKTLQDKPSQIHKTNQKPNKPKQHPITNNGKTQSKQP